MSVDRIIADGFYLPACSVSLNNSRNIRRKPQQHGVNSKGNVARRFRQTSNGRPILLGGGRCQVFLSTCPPAANALVE
jgi:hypothetical protein